MKGPLHLDPARAIRRFLQAELRISTRLHLTVGVEDLDAIVGGERERERARAIQLERSMPDNWCLDEDEE